MKTVRPISESATKTPASPDKCKPREGKQVQAQLRAGAQAGRQGHQAVLLDVVRVLSAARLQPRDNSPAFGSRPLPKGHTKAYIRPRSPMGATRYDPLTPASNTSRLLQTA